DKTGREARLFGEGFVFGDWGGAGDVSREALHRVFRDFDGRGERTILSRMILEFFNESDFVSLAKDLYYGRIERAKIPLLAPLVFDAAYEGDRVAVEIVKKVASETAISAWAIIKQLHLEREPIKVVLGGSIFKARGPLLFDLIKAELHSYIPMAKIVVPRYEPVVGALLLAFDHYTKVQIPEIFTNIDTTLPQHLKINREEESI
ncbi:MAG: N-acetylglucosamine kinase, partial [bacterium]